MGRDVVSVLNVSVSRHFLERLSLEDTTSWVLSFVTLGVVNIYAIHASGLQIYQEENNGSDLQETGCQVTDFTS